MTKSNESKNAATENTATVAPENTTENKAAKVVLDRLPKSFEEYKTLDLDALKVEPFRPSKNPVRIDSNNCVSKPAEKAAFRASVVERIDKLCRSRFSYNKALSDFLYKTLASAYEKRAPWIVTETLIALKETDSFDGLEIRRMCKYFELGGMDMQFPQGRNGLPVCEAIRDFSMQSKVLHSLKGVLVLGLKIKGGDEKQAAANAAASGDASERIRAGLKRNEKQARERAEKAETPEDKALFEKEQALATATREMLTYLAACEDPHAVVAEFKAWFENAHAKELESIKAKEQENMIKAGKAA